MVTVLEGAAERPACYRPCPELDESARGHNPANQQIAQHMDPVDLHA